MGRPSECVQKGFGKQLRAFFAGNNWSCALVLGRCPPPTAPIGRTHHYHP